MIDPEVVARLAARPRRDSPLEILTERELAVLALMAEGKSNHAIAARLYMSPKTVETHVGSMFAELGLPPVRRITAGCSRYTPPELYEMLVRAGGWPAEHYGDS